MKRIPEPPKTRADEISEQYTLSAGTVKHLVQQIQTDITDSMPKIFTVNIDGFDKITLSINWDFVIQNKDVILAELILDKITPPVQEEAKNVIITL